MKKTRPIRSAVDARTRTAFHEAGHAVLSAAINDRPHHVSIRENGHTLGRVGARRAARPTTLLQVHLAGFASEHILTGRRSRQLDQEVTFAVVARDDRALLDAFEGSEERDGHRAVQTVLAMGAADTSDEIKREVDRLYEVVRESLSTVWPAVTAVAKALLKHEELDRAALDEALGDLDIYAPVAAVQRAHGLLPAAPAAAAPKTTTPRPAAKTHEIARPRGDDPRIVALLERLKADPKLASVVVAFEATQKVASGRKFGSNGLKVNGKLFALFTQGTLVVKLSRERVAVLVAAGIGAQFDPGHGRLMKEWLTVTSAKVSWVELAKEAHEFVGGRR